MNWQSKARAVSRLLSSRLVHGSAILLYHRVEEERNDPFGLCVSPKHFEEQIIELKNTWKAMPVSELTERRSRGEPTRGCFAVTFDDGYIDVVKNALPVLERHQVPATVYLVSGCFGEDFWWDRLMDLVYESPKESGVITLERDGAKFVFEMAGSKRSVLFRNLYEFLRRTETASRHDLLEALGPQLSVDLRPPTSDLRRRAVTAAEARKLADHPLIEIGAHTVTHSQLASLTVEAQAGEIEGSIAQVRNVTGRPVSSFSYPFGLQGRDFTSETMRLARKAGVRCAMAADPGVVSRFSDDFALPRIWIHNEDASRMAARVKRWMR